MRLLVSSALLFVHTFVLFSNALPFSALRNESQFVGRRAPYSVVPVDGGQPDGTATPKTQIVTKDSTETIIEAPKTMPPKTETILSTTVVTDSEIPKTLLNTIATTSTPFTTQAPAPDIPPSATPTFATVTSLLSTVDIVSMTSSSLLTPYDDGMWHTTYYKTPEPLPSSETSSTAATVETPSAINDVQSATFAGVPSNGTYALMLRGKKEQRSPTAIINGTNITSSSIATTETKPPMPTLPIISESVNPVEVPSTDVAKHLVPGFDRRRTTILRRETRND